MRVVHAVMFAALAATVFGCSADRPQGDEATTAYAADEATRAYPTDERPLDSIALIERAVSEGLLDYSTGLLYKVYAMFDSASLPPEYESDVPVKCGTPLIIEVQRNWNRILPEPRAEIGIYITPLTAPGESGTELDDVTPERLEYERNRLD